jgi:hypothetical protein
VIGREQQIERVVQERLLIEAGIGCRRDLQRGGHDRDVCLAGEQQIEAFGGSGLDDPDVKAWVGPQQASGDRGEQCGSGCGETAHAKLAHGLVGAGDQLGPDLLPTLVQVVGAGQQDAPGRGELHPPAVGDQQGDAELL